MLASFKTFFLLFKNNSKCRFLFFLLQVMPLVCVVRVECGKILTSQAVNHRSSRN